MNIEEQWQAFATTHMPLAFKKDDAQKIASLIDLTLLDLHASTDQILALIDNAQRYQVAAVCVYPCHLTHLKAQGLPFKKATVVNFPEGEQPSIEVLKDIDWSVTLGADEIDYVFPYQTYLNGNEAKALAHFHHALAHCHQHQLTFKVIIETGAFKSTERLYKLCCQLLDSPCNFLKTSTGKIAEGATPLAVFCLLTAILNNQSQCGVKISGGVRTPEQAKLYVDMATRLLNKRPDKSWLRLGASTLLDTLFKPL